MKNWKILKKSGRSGKNIRNIGISTDFSTPACRWQPFGRNDIKHPQHARRKTQYAARKTHKERRLTEIFLNFPRHFVKWFV
jgi:hypothetical protein